VESRPVRLAGAPALVTYLASVELAKERGTVLFYHGFSGTKEKSAPYATALAEAGFLAVSVDALGHGERRYPNFESIFNDERWDTQFEATESDFLSVIGGSAAEVPSIIDELLERGWARPDGIGIAGRSMGGEITFASVLADRRLRAAVTVVGSPEWTLPRLDSPHHHPQRFFPVALLSQAAELDEYVPPAPIRRFHAALEPLYASAPERIRYVEYPGVGHFLTPELDQDSRRLLVGWFQRWLSPQRDGALV
jgi:dienelactone hydrolase